jgi:hypothetical protein
MRVFVQRSLAFALVGFAVVVSTRGLAQADSAASANAPAADEQPEEVTVRGRKSLSEYRLELERARDDIFRIFNEANEGTDTDIRCRDEQPTGTRTRRAVCRSNAENRAHAEAGRRFLNSLFLSSSAQFARLGGPGPPLSQAYSNFGTANTEQAAKVGEGDALEAFEEEWKRLLSENRDLYSAVATYVELEAEYAQARGDTATPPGEELTAALAAAPVSARAPSAPLCEASTLTEYQQRGNVARVSGTVSLSACSAGTTGSFTLIARVRDDAGEIKPIEFNETWQRADTQDHTFQTDYPIGDNVELMSVRVRGLKCTCAEPAQ